MKDEPIQTKQEDPFIVEHTWTTKLLEEKDTLQTKIQALSNFASSDEYRYLDQSSQLLLQAQLSVMITYTQLLTLRLTTNVQGDINED